MGKRGRRGNALSAEAGGRSAGIRCAGLGFDMSCDESPETRILRTAAAAFLKYAALLGLSLAVIQAGLYVGARLAA